MYGYVYCTVHWPRMIVGISEDKEIQADHAVDLMIVGTFFTIALSVANMICRFRNASQR